MIDFSQYDVVVVGAGISGAMFAREFAEQGKRVVIIEKRDHIAGNMYDYYDGNGILVQKYGPHCFHTNSKSVITYIEHFCDWYEYIANCNVFMHNIYTPSPFNFKTIDQFYSKEEATELKSALIRAYPDRKSVTIVELLESGNPLIKQYADFLFQSDYSKYTAKQWGIEPEHVDPAVLKRVPVLLNYDEQYFYDDYQAMPQGGFTAFVNKILFHKNIHIVLNTDILDYFSRKFSHIYLGGKKYPGTVVYTGEIDRLFGYKYGVLPYRSLRFEFETYHFESFQTAPFVAYPEADDYTRITEFTKMPYQKKSVTTIAKEYPQAYDIQKNEPYYPINNKINDEMHRKYVEEASAISNLILAGRLAKYKYFNMDQVMKDNLSIFNQMTEMQEE